MSHKRWTAEAYGFKLYHVQGKNVLRKEPMSREVEDTDAFHFNDQFQSKLFKIKVGTITATKETEPEKQETRQKVSCNPSRSELTLSQ